MDRQSVISAVRANEALFRQRGIAHVWLFGSVARDDAGPDSDVDLMFDADSDHFSLFDYSGLRQLAEESLPFPVDLLHRASLRPAIRRQAEADAVQVF